ncbi:MAG: phenylalanine--tRNA ligase beta subunit-related protein [Thermodesulfobacteriota bacterium]
MFTVSDTWKNMYPGALMGALALGNVTNPKSHAALDKRKKELEQDLRSLFHSSEELKSLQPIVAYRDYYKRFKKSYHVLHQLESLVFKGKSIPAVAALVEAMFMAELNNMLLTAGHDLDAIAPPLTLSVATGHETYVKLNGEEQITKPGDMIISDAQAIISSVIYGPDRRTRITENTRRVLFTTYGVPGVGDQALRQHLQGIESNVRLVAPDAVVEHVQIYRTD